MPELEPITREEKFLNGEVGMTPITREEKILAGEDIETVTRREYFLKKYRGGGGGDITVESLSVTSNGTYTAPSGKAYSPVSVNVPLPQNAYLLKSVANLPQAIASFNDGADAPMKSLKVAIEPQQEGSGDPSTTNIRPFIGWDEVNVGVVGKNLCNPEECARVQTSADATYRNGFVISKVGTYTIKSYNNTGSNVYIYYKIIENGEYGTSQIIQQGAVPGPSKTITITEGKSIVIYDAIDESLNKAKELFGNVQIEVGSSATDFVPYNGTTYTIDLDGTRYGGELDVVSGVLTVDRVMKTFSNTDLWTVSGNNVYLTISDGGNGEIISDIFLNGNTSGKASYVSSNNRLYVWDAVNVYEVTTREECQTFFNSHQVIYPLAEPLTIQLTPTQVSSLLGVNNIWADTGDITDAEYFSKEV